MFSWDVRQELSILRGGVDVGMNLLSLVRIGFLNPRKMGLNRGFWAEDRLVSSPIWGQVWGQIISESQAQYILMKANEQSLIPFFRGAISALSGRMSVFLCV